nr:hypothetical protein [Tanacetum cinerariifolium]
MLSGRKKGNHHVVILFTHKGVIHYVDLLSEEITWAYETGKVVYQSNQGIDVGEYVDMRSEHDYPYFYQAIPDGPDVLRFTRTDWDISMENPHWCLRGVVRALVELRADDILHLNICPENVLLKSGKGGDYTVKLCRMGECRDITSLNATWYALERITYLMVYHHWEVDEAWYAEMIKVPEEAKEMKKLSRKGKHLRKLERK